MTDASFINIGTPVEEQIRIDQLADQIIRVATCSPFKSVCEDALQIFQEKIQTHVSISNCLFSNNAESSKLDQGVPVRGSGWTPSAE